MKTLIERLRFHASDAWPYATMVSNMGHPESDNNFGRAATDMVEAADRIAQLEALVRRYMHSDDIVDPPILHAEAERLLNGTALETACEYCDGQGHEAQKICVQCDGSGVIRPAETDCGHGNFFEINCPQCETRMGLTVNRRDEHG